MLIRFILVVLSLTISHGEIVHAQVFSKITDLDVRALLSKAQIATHTKSDLKTKLIAIEENTSQKSPSTSVIDSEDLTNSLIHKYTELKNSIEKLEQIIDLKFKTFEQMLDERIDLKYEKTVHKLKNFEMESYNTREQLQTLSRELETILYPGTPHITSTERTFTIVEVDQTATSYNKLVKKKDYADVSLTWTIGWGAPADTSRITLNGTEVWSGAGNSTSASFKVRKGGKYTITVSLCIAKRSMVKCCNNSTEIVVADTDGSHLPPIEFLVGKNDESFNQISGKVVAAYFMEWGVYEKQFPVDRVPASNLTHLLYSLIPICGSDINKSMKTDDGLVSCSGREDFKVSIHDTWAALKMPRKVPYNETYKGNFGQLMMLKQAKPDLKILMSVGGLTLSDPFFYLSDKKKRDTFITSVKDFLQTWKFFDGVDIMWIYPKTAKDGITYVQLMKDLREMLDELSTETSRKYELTSAIGAKWDQIQVIDYNNAQKYMDHIFLMSYGFKQPNDSPGYYANLYAPAWNALEANTDFATKYLLAQGVKPEKIVLGLCLYGVGWTGVHSYEADNPFTGNATGSLKGTWEKGWVYYSQIIQEIAQGKWEYHYDGFAEAPYVFKDDTGDLITYEDVRSTIAKAKYVRDNQLGGLFVRGIDADNGDILNAMNTGLGNSI